MYDIKVIKTKEILKAGGLKLPTRPKPLDLPLFPVSRVSDQKFRRLPDYRPEYKLNTVTVDYYRTGSVLYWDGANKSGAQVIEDDMLPMSANLIAWRGFNVEDEPYKGMRIRRRGFTSASLSSEIASGFLRHGLNYNFKVLAKLRIPSGTYAIVSNVKEQEIILDRGTEFVITKVLGQFIVGRHTDIPCYVVHANVL